MILALGRRPRVKGFGLEELGVEIAKNGTIQSDEFLRTNYPNIYVCGDVAGPYQFTHVASHQAWYASVNALFSPFKEFKADYRVIPWTTFTDPEVAHVGRAYALHYDERFQHSAPRSAGFGCFEPSDPINGHTYQG